MGLNELEKLLPVKQDYKRDQKTICTTISYLIGTDWDYCKHVYTDEEAIWQELENNQTYATIHHLCRLRTKLMLYARTINMKLKHELQNLSDISHTKDSYNALKTFNVGFEYNGTDSVEAIVMINMKIADNIEKIKPVLPEWVNWDFIKRIFLMPHGQTYALVVGEMGKFCRNKSYYPYKQYLNWTPKNEGNILLNDKKFLRILYAENNATFDDISKVVDAKKSTVKDIYEFIGSAENIQIIVDCENSNVFKFASVLTQLNKDELEKINKIVLYDDDHTTDAWKYLQEVTNIPIERHLAERVNEHKSLVDIKMSVGITKAFYKDNITSFILLSSDSDFWGVISSIPDADFLVMAERDKSGSTMLSAMKMSEIYYCFIDDFCTGNINRFKNNIIKSELESYFDDILNEMNGQDILDTIIKNLRIDVNDDERKNLYNKLIQKLVIRIDKEGIIHIRTPQL